MWFSLLLLSRYFAVVVDVVVVADNVGVAVVDVFLL
jgi:hypothetical protein